MRTQHLCNFPVKLQRFSKKKKNEYVHNKNNKTKEEKKIQPAHNSHKSRTIPALAIYLFMLSLQCFMNFVQYSADGSCARICRCCSSWMRIRPGTRCWKLFLFPFITSESIKYKVTRIKLTSVTPYILSKLRGKKANQLTMKRSGMKILM